MSYCAFGGPGLITACMARPPSTRSTTPYPLIPPRQASPNLICPNIAVGVGNDVELRVVGPHPSPIFAGPNHIGAAAADDGQGAAIRHLDPRDLDVGAHRTWDVGIACDTGASRDNDLALRELN